MITRVRPSVYVPFSEKDISLVQHGKGEYTEQSKNATPELFAIYIQNDASQ